VTPETQYATVALQASTENDLRTLTEFADFWKTPYSTDVSSSPTQVIMSSGALSESEATTHPTVLSPTGPENARKICERLHLDLDMDTSLVHLRFSRSAETSIATTVYRFKGPALETVIDSDGIPILSRIGTTNIYLLSIDLASEYAIRLSDGLEDPPSMKFRIATRLPFSYRMIPSFIRNRAFKRDEPTEVAKEKLAPLECLRSVFLASLLTASEAPIPIIGFWRRGKKFAAAVTHDVETAQGLVNGSQQLLRVEEDLKIRSTWNIVTNRYQLTREKLRPLALAGEIGAHDTNHDGRLIFLPADAQIERLRSCKAVLEKLAESRVKGFRAPLLQHDKKLLGSVGRAGYGFDSSVPSWELLSPTSLRSHGVGTVFPLEVEGIVEAPVSLPQDHQLLRVSGLTPSEAGNTLIEQSRWLREIGGLCTLLVHPDYDFATQADSEEYSRVLRAFNEDPSCDIMTLGEVSDWWSYRQSAVLEISDDGPRISSIMKEEGGDLEIKMATSYGKNGFIIDHLN